MNIYYCEYDNSILLVESDWIGDNGSKWTRVQFDEPSAGAFQFFSNSFRPLEFCSLIGEL